MNTVRSDALMARKRRDPQLLALFFGALLAGLVGVVAIAETRSWWVAGVTAAAVILLVLALVIDVATVDGGSRHRLALRSHQPPPPASGPERPGFDYRGPDASRRLLVMTSEPLAAERVLKEVTRRTGRSEAPAALGVMVVSPEGFGAREITNDEGHYEAAHRAEAETVASLRRASVKAAGHVGDHDAAQAIDDALALFPAERVLVFAHPAYAAAYRSAIDAATVGPPVDIVDLPD